MELHQLIYNLLFKEQCVIVPDLGGFITRDSPSGINPMTKEIKPRTKSVFFNAHMLYDDGLLINHVSSLEKISFDDAKDLIASKVSDIKNVLEVNKKLSFGEIGELIKNNEGNIILLVNKNLNLNLSTFGLESIGLKPIKRELEEVVTVPITEENEVIVQEIAESQRSNRWMPIAASVLLLATLGYFAFANNWFGNSEELIADNEGKTEHTASVLPLDSEEIEEPKVVSEDLNAVVLDESEVLEEGAEIEDDIEDSQGEIEEPTVQKEELPIAEVDNLSPDKAKYLVVLGSFLNEENAERYLKILAKKGIEVSLYKKENSSLNRLVYRGFESEEIANQEKNELINTLRVNAMVFKN